MSLSIGISEEIEDAKITAEKTKSSRLKRRSVTDRNSRDQIEQSDINLSGKTRKHYENLQKISVISEFWHLTTFDCDFDNSRLLSLSLPQNHMKPLMNVNINDIIK